MGAQRLAVLLGSGDGVPETPGEPDLVGENGSFEKDKPSRCVHGVHGTLLDVVYIFIYIEYIHVCIYIYNMYIYIYIIFVATLCLYNCYVCWFPNSLPGEVNKFRSQIWSLTLAPLCISREATTSTGEHDPGYLLLIRNHKYHIYIYIMIYTYQILSYQYYKYLVDHNLIYNFNSNPNACQQSVQYPNST